MPIRKNLDSLINKMQTTQNTQSNNAQSFDIEGLFKPAYDKNGTFEITLRFLPPVASEDLPYIENRDHWLTQSNGKKFTIPCRKRFADPANPGQKLHCPICEYNQKMWEKYKDAPKGTYGTKKLATARPEYICNVLIVRNDNQPETEGQVFRFKYSKQIKDLLDNSVNDGEADENGEVTPGINPYSYYGPNDQEVISGEVRAGANFVWKAVRTDNGPKYDGSHFNKPSRISRCIDGVNSQGQPCKKFQPYTDAEIESIESRIYTLKELELPVEKVRSYEDTLVYFQKKAGWDLRPTLGVTAAVTESEYIATTKPAVMNTAVVDDEEMFAGTPLETPKPAAFAEAPAPKPVMVENEDDFFANMVEM